MAQAEAHNFTKEEAEEWVIDDLGDVEIGDDSVAQLAEEKIEEHNKTLGTALEERWEPKTLNGSRSIPYDIDIRVQLAIEEFVERYEVFPKARVAVNRRVTEATEAADIHERVYPHAFRATGRLLLTASPFARPAELRFALSSPPYSFVLPPEPEARRSLLTGRRPVRMVRGICDSSRLEDGASALC